MIIGRQTVLIVEDEDYSRELIKLALEQGDYEVVEARSAKEALGKMEREPPDLIITDILMPEMDGWEFIQKIKSSHLTDHVPVLVCSAKHHVVDVVKGIELGVDEYIGKPFDPIELEARVKMILRRVHRERDVSPLTNLPGNLRISYEIDKRIEAKKPFAVIYLDLDNFKPFNDYYGYELGDKVIKMTAGLVIDAVTVWGKKEDIVGHIGGDDFLVVTKARRAVKIADEIVKRFDEAIPRLYDEKDRKKGYIATKDRKGEERRYGLLTVSVVIVDSTKTHLESCLELSDRVVELKEHAKAQEGSVVVKERRKTSQQEASG